MLSGSGWRVAGAVQSPSPRRSRRRCRGGPARRTAGGRRSGPASPSASVTVGESATARATATARSVAVARASRRASYAASATEATTSTSTTRTCSSSTCRATERLPSARAAHARHCAAATPLRAGEHNDHNGDRGSHRSPDSERHAPVPPGVTRRHPMSATIVTRRGSTGRRRPQEPDPLPLRRRHRRGRRSASPSGCVAPDVRRRAQAARPGVRRADQDDDPAGHLLHDRARRRLGGQRRPGRQGRRAGARLLPHHVDVRAGDRPGRRQHPPPRRRAAARRGRRERRPGAGGGRARQHHRVPARDHPRLAVLLADLRRGAADAAGRAAGRLRAAGDGPRRRAGPRAASGTSSGWSSGCWR